MKINLVADDSVGSAPSGFTAAVQAAADIIDANFSDNITLNLRYGWGSYDNVIDLSLNGSEGAYANALAGDSVSYATVKSWLTADAKSTNDSTAIASLPASSSAFPHGNSVFYVTSAQEKALGHFTGSSSAIDGAIALGTGTTSQFWTGIALHELTHAMGRLTDFYEPNPVILDMFRYDATGHFQWTEGSGGAAPSYFSIDGGRTDLADFGRTSDYSDFLNSGVQGSTDAFNEFYRTDTSQTLTPIDIATLDVIGFDVGGASSQTDDYRDTYNDSSLPLGKVTVGGTATGAIERVGDKDVFAVTLTAGQPYTFNLDGWDTSSTYSLRDPRLRLLDSSGNLLTANDDISSSNWGSQITAYVPSTSGTYYLEASSSPSDGTYTTGSYQVRVQLGDDFRNTYNNASLPLGNLAIGHTATGSIDYVGDSDVFQVTLTAGTHYTFNLDGSDTSSTYSLRDPYLRLLDSAGNQLSASDDISSSNWGSQIGYDATASGTYYLVAASSPSDGTYTTGNYQIRASAGAATGSGSSPNVAGDPASAGGAPATATGTPQIFDFTGIGFGHDTIAGFDPTRDVVRVNDSLVDNFTTLQSDMSATGSGTLIALDAGHSITLDGVAPASLTAANFRFG